MSFCPYIICVFDPEYLFSEVLQVVERGLRGDGVYQEEALPILHVQVPHRCELLRAGRIQDLQHALLAVHFNDFAVAVFYRWVILLHENALHKLHCLQTQEHETDLVCQGM